MVKKLWQPDKGLIDNGWHFFSLANDNNDKLFRERQSETFRSTITIGTEFGMEMYVRAFSRVPEDQNPGGGFRQIGRRTPEDLIDDKYMDRLSGKFKKVTGIDPTSKLILPGPYYAPSSVVEGKFEKVKGYDRIIWMR